MKILFISHNTHQHNYFKQVIDNIKFSAKIVRSPFCFNIFSTKKIIKQLNINKILKVKFLEVDIKYTNKIANKLYKLILKLQTPFIASGYIKEIKKSDANIIAFWNGKKYPQNIGVAVTKLLNKQTLFFENGALPNTTAIDFYGLNATATIPKDIKTYKNYTTKAKLNKNLTQRKEEKKRIKDNISLPPNFIFVPFQVGYDSQLIYHSPWIDTMDELFDIIDEISKKLKIYFIFKEHPSDKKSDYSHLHKKAKNNNFINFANAIATPKLIQKCDTIVTINSSVGIEGLLYNKKIITLGEAFYNIEGLVKHANNKKELEEILYNKDNWKIDTKLIEKFLLYLQEEYLIKDSWKNPTDQHFKQIIRKLKEYDDKTNL